MVIPTTSYLACAEERWILRMTVDYHNLNQVVTPIVAVVADVVSLLEKVNTHPGKWYVSIWIWSGKCLFIHPCPLGPPEADCFQLARPVIHLHCPTS